MNWVGGTRNRLKVKNEKKKQMEFFEKQKYVRRMKMYGKLGEQKLPSKPSLDLVSLQMATLTAKQFQSNDKISKTNEQRNRVNMERRVYNNARLNRHQNVELPMSPNATPSILHLGDDIQSSTQEPRASNSLHNFRRDIQVSMHHSQQYSQASRHCTHTAPASYCDTSVSHVKSTEREDSFSSLNQQLGHIRKNFSEDVFFQFPSSSKGSEGHKDNLPSHLPPSHGASSTEMSFSSDTSEDSPDLLVKHLYSEEVTLVDSDEEGKLAKPYTTNPASISRTSCVPNVPIQSENNSGSSLENFRRHFRSENQKRERCCTPSPICLDTSTDSLKQSSGGSIDLLCHESTNFTSPESVCDQRPEERGKFGDAKMPGNGEATTRKQLSEEDSSSRWHAGVEVQTCRTAATDQYPEIKTDLQWKSVCRGGVPQEPRNLCGDVPTLNGQPKEGSLPVPSKSTGLPYGGGSLITRAVLKEVLDLDAELNGHHSPGGQCRPLKRRKMLPDPLENFSLSVPSTLDKSCNPKETALCEDTLISDRNTPPVSPFTRDVQRRALESIALFTPEKVVAKQSNAEKLEDEKYLSELSDSEISAQGESSKTLSGQNCSAGSHSEASSVLKSSLISQQDRGIQCKIASIQPSMKEQSTQSCSHANSDVKKDVQIQTCRSLLCDAGTQWEKQETPDHENQHSGNACDSLKSEEVSSDDADITDSKEKGKYVVSIKAKQQSHSDMKGKNGSPSAEGKLNSEDRSESSELPSQSTCSDSFDSCTSH